MRSNYKDRMQCPSHWWQYKGNELSKFATGSKNDHLLKNPAMAFIYIA